MILVDINVYALNKVYDFTLDETVPISAVVEEIAEIIGRLDNKDGIEGVEGLMLLTKDGTYLQPNQTLEMCNINTGSSLILI